MKNKTILVIEDEKNIQTLIKYNIEQSGFSVITSARGDEGLKKACAEKPDLIILDLMLPGLQGLDVCKAISDNGVKSQLTSNEVYVILRSWPDLLEFSIQTLGITS